MCGIAGIIAADGVDAALLGRMSEAITHRGPDDQGVWIDQHCGIGLAHRRLSIVDLSPSGHQPMESADGRYVLVYNGEVYNHAELRQRLERDGGAPDGGWRGHSDTETLLQSIAIKGLVETLMGAVGMFAFALWDRQERLLHLVRDRFGEKPLYYGWAGRDLLFASELKAMRLHPRFSGEISRRALHHYAARSYIPAPLSIYKRVFKLEPGCILTVSPEEAAQPRDAPPAEGEGTRGFRLQRYWSYAQVVNDGLERPIANEAEAIEALESVLEQAIRGQSIADVPVGAFLSGGIDSSTVVALYQKYSSQPVRTFTIGFEEEGFNEAEHAKAVARHLGTVHNEHYLTVDETRDVVPLLPAMYDEPFADSSQIPTHLVSRFARTQVKVALSGDGGDELFAGYNRHFLAPGLWDRLRRVPRPLRSLAGASLGRMPSSFWSGVAGVMPGAQPHLGAKLQKGLRIAGSARSFDDVYASFLDEWGLERSPVLGTSGHQQGFPSLAAEKAGETVRAMYCDAVSYLPDDILCKVDRAAMAVSLETRVPFLDHRVAEIAARIPIDLKVRCGKGKHILRKLLYREAPEPLFDRPKAGFAVPVGEWIKGPLRPWAEELLDPARMASEGWFDPAIIQRRWSDHLRGQRNSTPAIWSILMFQAWLREQAQPLRAAA